MKVLVLYRRESEYGRKVDDFIREFKARAGEHKIDVISIDSKRGSDLARLYDIMDYPAILVTTNDGYVQNSWIGEHIPLIDEVIGYANA